MGVFYPGPPLDMPEPDKEFENIASNVLIGDFTESVSSGEFYSY